MSNIINQFLKLELHDSDPSLEIRSYYSFCVIPHSPLEYIVIIIFCKYIFILICYNYYFRKK